MAGFPLIGLYALLCVTFSLLLLLALLKRKLRLTFFFGVIVTLTITCIVLDPEDDTYKSGQIRGINFLGNSENVVIGVTVRESAPTINTDHAEEYHQLPYYYDSVSSNTNYSVYLRASSSEGGIHSGPLILNLRVDDDRIDITIVQDCYNATVISRGHTSIVVLQYMEEEIDVYVLGIN